MNQCLEQDLRLVRIWNLLMHDGRTVKVATIEQGERKPSMCEGCSAPCCRGIFKPILTSEELLTRKYKTKFIPVPIYIAAQLAMAGKHADYLAVLDVPDNAPCPYFDIKTNKCKLWPNPPKACLAYDCREDDRPEIREFVKKREKWWKKHKGD